MATTGPKRSLFKKPAWAATESSTPQIDENAVFGRSRVYEDILEEERKRKEKRAAKAKARAENGGGRESKRRRISDDREDGSDHSDTQSIGGHGSEDSHEENVERERHVTRATPTKKQRLVSGLEESRIKSRTARPNTVINLEDVEDEEDISSAPGPRKLSPEKHSIRAPESDPESEDDDEYTRELKRKTREKARLRKAGMDTANSPDFDLNRIKSPSLPADHLQSTSAQSPADLSRGTPSTQEDDPTISIYLHSLLPNTRDLIVHRRASQSLADVLEIWCQRQGIGGARKSELFLVWRGQHKLFSTTTMNVVLAMLKKERPTGPNRNEDPSHGKIEIEVMDQRILEYRQKQRDKLIGIMDEAEPEPEPEPEVQAPPEPRCIIQLRAQCMEPMQLRVRPTTTIHKIMVGFKMTKKVEVDKTCWLVFDGERLEPESTVADVGIEDEDVIEVLIR